MQGFVYHPETEFEDYDLLTVGEHEDVSPPGWECTECGRMFQARLLGVSKQPPETHFCQPGMEESIERISPALAESTRKLPRGVILDEMGDPEPAPKPVQMVTMLCQLWEERERGWGVRPDGYSLHASREVYDAYIKKIYAGRSMDYVPDEYEATRGEPYWCDVDINSLPESKTGSWRFWSGNYPAKK